MDAKQVPLRELLASVPADARLVIDDADGKGTRSIPVGRLCQEAAAALVEDAMQKFTEVSQEIEAALAEPVQQGCDHCNQPLYAAIKCRVCGRVAEPTTEDSSAVEPVQEPVAFAHINGTSDTKWHPPQRKPLTEEEIDSIWDSEKAFADIYAIARAIERAHGIDGAPEERHFCPRCGKRTNDIHTCTPPAPLTDEVIADLWHQNGGFHHHFARAIERWLRGHA